MVENDSQLTVSGQFTPSESQLLKDILDQNVSVELVIPDTIEPEKLWDSLQACCRAAAMARDASNKIKPLIGRMLIVIQSYPELFQERGYRTYDEFMSKGMESMFGIHRAEAYHLRRIAEVMPHLTTEEFRQIGIAKLELLAAIPEHAEGTRRELTEQAKEGKIKVEDLRQHVAELRHQEPGELRPATITVVVNQEVARRWREFSKSPAIQAFCETDSPGKIFERLLDECSTEWLASGEYMLQSNRG